jgi:hypothetical protein
MQTFLLWGPLIQGVLAFTGALFTVFGLKTIREPGGLDTMNPHPLSWRVWTGLTLLFLATLIIPALQWAHGTESPIPGPVLAPGEIWTDTFSILLMKNLFLPALVAVVSALLTYRLTRKATIRDLSKEERERRIRRVFDRYMSALGKTGGYDGLVKAGVATLKSDDEIRELIQLIIGHGELTPIGSIPDDVSLKKVFDYAAAKRIDFLQHGALEKTIEGSGARIKRKP